jgi:Cu/Ag efflux protein CusF
VSAVVATLAGLAILPAQAQVPQEETETHKCDMNAAVESTIPFTGKIRSINEDGRQLTIEATGIPEMQDEVTTLPYSVPDSVDFSQFKEDMAVSGDFVVRDKRSCVENLKVTGAGDAKPDDGQGQTPSWQRDTASSDSQTVVHPTELQGQDPAARPDAARKEAHDSMIMEKSQPATGTADAGDAAGAADARTDRERSTFSDADALPEKTIRFEGEIESINTRVRELTIDAKGIPEMEDEFTRLQYILPDSVDLSQFKEGDHVTGELVVRDNRSIVQSVKVGDKTDKADKADKTPSTQY